MLSFAFSQPFGNIDRMLGNLRFKRKLSSHHLLIEHVDFLLLFADEIHLLFQKSFISALGHFRIRLFAHCGFIQFFFLLFDFQYLIVKLAHLC